MTKFNVILKFCQRTPIVWVVTEKFVLFIICVLLKTKSHHLTKKIFLQSDIRNRSVKQIFLKSHSICCCRNSSNILQPESQFVEIGLIVILTKTTVWYSKSVLFRSDTSDIQKSKALSNFPALHSVLNKTFKNIISIRCCKNSMNMVHK